MFTANDMRELIQARPFVPFRLITSDGREIEVRSPEVVLPGRRLAVIGLLDADATDTFFDRWTTIWYMHVTRAEFLAPGAPPFSATPPAEPQPVGT
ncbi:MAG: hypothetical protein K2W96_25405 [Gemmataceae bacterium]|nr:hypothetical protein [Gemmataceae bacterium]